MVVFAVVVRIVEFDLPVAEVAEHLRGEDAVVAVVTSDELHVLQHEQLHDRDVDGVADAGVLVYFRHLSGAK